MAAQEEAGMEVLDSIDTLMLFLLHDKGWRSLTKSVKIDGHDEIPIAHTIPPTDVECPLTTFGDDRLFTLDPELLLKDPVDLHGESSEVCLLDETARALKWIMHKRTNRSRLKRYVHLYPKDSVLYEQHQRVIYESGNAEYWVEPLAWSPSRKKAFTVFRDRRQRDRYRGDDLTNVFTVTASLLEDALPFWTVRVKANKGLRVYADELAIKELCHLRDNPTTPSGRMKPILHWVKTHLRKTERSPEGVEIEKHLRGCTEFTLDGYAVSIINPRKP